jgi:hypothetical protein
VDEPGGGDGVTDLERALADYPMWPRLPWIDAAPMGGVAGVLVVTSIVDTDLGVLVETRLPDGRLVYGFDPALPVTEGQSTPD